MTWLRRTTEPRRSSSCRAGGAFELLISDVQMPGVDGIELIEKALVIAPKMRVILMSGFAGELDRAKHLKSKIAREISKPFTLEQVRAAVRGRAGVRAGERC